MQTGCFTAVVRVTNIEYGCTTERVYEDVVCVGRPVEFEYDASIGCQGMMVQFTDISPDPADSVRWNFGDGNTSMEANPGHAFADPGCFNVTLTRWVNGCQSSYTPPQCILVNRAPQASYTVDNNIACEAPFTVNFQGMSTEDIDGWHWDFGDNVGFSNQRNPTYTYTQYGTFAVTLTVTSLDGCEASFSSDSVVIQAPRALVAPDRFFDCGPLDVTLADMSTSVSNVIDWEWTVYIDASSPPISYTSTDQNPSFTLVDTGRYDIQLIVTDDLGCRDMAVFTNQIGVGMPPVVDFDASTRSGCVNTEISFFDLSSDYTDEWIWDFGDGNDASDQFPSHSYTDTGFFDVTLIAGHLGCVAELTIDSFIYLNPPVAAFAFDRDCSVPYSVSINDLSIGAELYRYDFGVDGTETDTSTDPAPSYTYANTGVYSVRQIVENTTTGCIDTSTLPITITDPDSRFEIDTTRGCWPLEINITNSSEFNSGNYWVADGASISDPTSPTPILTYNTPGTFSGIELVITDVNSCTDTFTVTDSIYVNGVDVAFGYSITGGCRPFDTYFTDSTSATFATVTSWIWDFGDGTAGATVPNPQHTYDTIGFFEVGLRVTDSWGCVGLHSVPDLIEVTEPRPEFSADTLGCTQSTIRFFNASQGTALSYLWDFGDGNTSTEVSPEHFYGSEGVYTVCLTLTDKYGCDSTLCKTDFVQIANPIAGFNADNTLGTCPPLVVNFENTSTFASEYIWNFGDSSGNSIIVEPAHAYTIPGVYDVTLVAVSTDRCADTLVIEDYITVEGPGGDFTFDVDRACVPATVTFSGYSDEAYDFIWDFGDGSLDSTQNVMGDTVTYTYNEVGVFNPAMILVNDQGCARTIASANTITTETLVADFTTTDSLLCDNNASPTFSQTSYTTLNLTGIKWYFPGTDTDSSFAISPTVTFPGEGLYDVTMIVHNELCSDTLTKEEYIRVGATPTAAFAASPDEVCQPGQVTFTDASTIGGGNSPIVEWQWQTGEGSTLTGQNSSFTYDTAGTFFPMLTVSTEIGCSDSVSQAIVILENPIVQIPEPEVICIGEQAQINVQLLSPNVVDYYWLPDPTLSCTDCLDPIANPVDTTLYTFISTNDYGCNDTTQVRVNVRPFRIPVVVMSNDTTMCITDTIALYAGGGDPGASYIWSIKPPELSCDDCQEPRVSPVTQTSYEVTVTNPSGCSASGSTTVDVIDERTAFLGEDRTICVGDTIRLNSNMGNDPYWLGYPLSCNTCPEPYTWPDARVSTYQASITTDNGCRIHDSMDVNVMYPEDIDAGTDLTICIGETIRLTGTLLTGDVQWSPVSEVGSPNQITTSTTPDTSTTFVFAVTEGECTLYDSVHIEVLDDLTLLGEDMQICEGQPEMAVINSGADELLWLPPDGLSDITSATPLVGPSKTTTYTIIGSLRGCLFDTMQMTVEVLPSPEVEAQRYYTVAPGQTVKLSVTPDNVSDYTYDWSPRLGLSCTECLQPAVTTDTSKFYTLMSTDIETGCMDSLQVEVKVLNACGRDLIYMPNLFTPNGDGENDYLKVQTAPILEEIKSFSVYDRWGDLIYQTTDINGEWDGRVNGLEVQTGVYVYLIEAVCPMDGTPIFLTGDISLVRQ